MNGKRITTITLSALVVACLTGLSASTLKGGTTESGYDMGFRNVTNLHSDLFLALDRKQRTLTVPTSALLGKEHVPCIASIPGSSSASRGGPVQISAGFIEFINLVAHAKAIDETEHGFFARYKKQIAQQPPSSTAAPDFGNALSANARSFQTMNRQASHFNQMVGGLIAIDLAHQYLGHYNRHASELQTQASYPIPLNNFITEQEWRDAVLRGAHNSLGCGLGVEGLKTVFECFDKMPNRPAWAAYFIHPKANISKINSDLAKLERGFFAMDMEMQKAGSGKTFGLAQ